jgi:hypothetical protein
MNRITVIAGCLLFVFIVACRKQNPKTVACARYFSLCKPQFSLCKVQFSLCKPGSPAKPCVKNALPLQPAFRIRIIDKLPKIKRFAR